MTPETPSTLAESRGDGDPLGVLATMGLIVPGDNPRLTELSGGVSSDIWLVETDNRRFVLKRPKHQLNVKSTWIVPVARGQAEVDWLTVVGEYFPDNVPHVVAYDPDTFTIALSFLPPQTHTNWKSDLMGGRVEAGFASDLGRLLADIHSVTYQRQALASTFRTDDLFHLLRIEPFFQRTAAALPVVANPLARVIESITATSVALVHGDFSPKNILVDRTVTPARPIVLDAECAVWGDPAFDVAFCLAHLALKSVHVSSASEDIIEAASQFRRHYLDTCDAEVGGSMAERLATLVPALLLARIVGGSPAGYLTAKEEDRVKNAAVTSLLSGEPCGALLHPEKGLSDSPW